MDIYAPNHIPCKTRVVNILMSAFLIIYGTVGIYRDDIYYPGRQGRPGIHFQGGPAWILYAAMICATLNLLSVVADHYDERNNETNYRFFAKVTGSLGWILVVVAIVLTLVFQQGTR